MGRVRIGTCSGPADAALVRAAFQAHGIPVLINAEQHASMLGGLGGAFVPLHIFVDDEHAEDASALLADLREHDQTEQLPEADDESDEDRAHGLERSGRRRRSGIILMIVLAGAVATPYVIGKPLLSVLLVASCLGAMFLTLRPAKRVELPRARVRRRPD